MELLLRQAMQLLKIAAHPPESCGDPEPFQIMLRWEAGFFLVCYFL
jgi:hypothetical protein